MTIAERFEGCIIAGAIGDALGSAYENMPTQDAAVFYLFGEPKKQEPFWQITDDTQLTLATCEAMLEDATLNPEIVAKHFLKLYKQRTIRGLGASTLKALRELDLGLHWSQVGRKGEYAAGNGAAMRIAPLAFCSNLSNKTLQEICSITHQNDEAYAGALCIILAIRAAIAEDWTGSENLFDIIIPQIPDTKVRDKLLEINKIQHKWTLEQIGQLGNDGYVVNAVPLAIAAANKINQMSLEKIYNSLITIGGDTDTTCSMAGQIIGALIGIEQIPTSLVQKLQTLSDYSWIRTTIDNVVEQQFQ